jgi:hypothetical protein
MTQEELAASAPLVILGLDIDLSQVSVLHEDVFAPRLIRSLDGRGLFFWGVRVHDFRTFRFAARASYSTAPVWARSSPRR